MDSYALNCFWLYWLLREGEQPPADYLDYLLDDAID
jgi:hypothetical protein